MLAVLIDGGEARAALERMCRVCVAEFVLTGVAVSLVVGGRHRGTLAASDAWAGRLAEVQFTLGEGPCVEASAGGGVVSEPQLAASTRWPMFGPEAGAANVVAAFSVPLQVRGGSYGSLGFYRDTAGPLGEDALADMAAVAAVVTTVVVGMNAPALAAVPGPWAGFVTEQTVVHQATGMVSAQLDVTLEAALVALQARAYADGSALQVVAVEVVARRLRFDR